MDLGERWASKDSCNAFVSWSKHINSFYMDSIILRFQEKGRSDSLTGSRHLFVGSRSPVFDWRTRKLQGLVPSGRNDTDIRLKMRGVVLASNELEADKTDNHQEYS